MPDESLSHPAGQACASCHASAVAFSDPDKSSPTSAGVTGLLFGNRNAPTVMYAAFSPPFGRDEEGSPVGGQFLDGRAATLEAQARGPFVNVTEMANPDVSTVVAKLRAGPSAVPFASVYGVDALADDATAFERMARAIAAFERTSAFAPFSSKYDAWLACVGRATLASHRPPNRRPL